MTWILVPVSGSVSEDHDCDYAIVEIDIEQYERFCAKFRSFRDKQDWTEMLTEMAFTSDAEGFISSAEARKLVAELPQDMAAVAVENDPYEANVSVERTECDELHVTPSGFYWSCVPKHTDLRIETVLVTLDTLREIAKREETK